MQAGNGPHTIAPGAGLPPGYGTLNLNGGMTTNHYTTLAFNLNLSTPINRGSDGNTIYGGDLINMGGSALTSGNEHGDQLRQQPARRRAIIALS